MFFTILHNFKLCNFIPRTLTFKIKNRSLTLILNKDTLLKIHWTRNYLQFGVNTD